MSDRSYVKRPKQIAYEANWLLKKNYFTRYDTKNTHEKKGSLIYIFMKKIIKAKA